MAQHDDRSSEWAVLEDNRKHWLSERDKCNKLIRDAQAHGHPPTESLQQLEKIDLELKRIKQQQQPILRQMKRS